MGKLLYFKPRKEEDLIVGTSLDGKMTLSVKSIKAKTNFLRMREEANKKRNLIRDKNYVCGDCAAYPCFREYNENSPALLCFQETRKCRQECNDFIQDRYSGKAPDFQITGTCKRDNKTVNYLEECRFNNKDN